MKNAATTPPALKREPQERFDAKFGWLSVHLVVCPPDDRRVSSGAKAQFFLALNVGAKAPTPKTHL